MIKKVIESIFGSLEKDVEKVLDIEKSIQDNKLKAVELSQEFNPIIKRLERDFNIYTYYCNIKKGEERDDGLITLNRLNDKLKKAKSEYFKELSELRKSNTKLSDKLQDLLSKDQVKELVEKTKKKDSIDKIIKSLNEGVLEYDKLEKAHKYIRREGVKGNYKYIYREGEKKERKKEENESDNQKVRNKIFDVAKEIAKKYDILFQEKGGFDGTSLYALIRGKKFRISDHGISDKWANVYGYPDYNLSINEYNKNEWSDKKDEFFEKIGEVLKKDEKVEKQKEFKLVKIFNKEDDIKEGEYKVRHDRKDQIWKINSIDKDKANVTLDYKGDDERTRNIGLKYILNWEQRVGEERDEVVNKTHKIPEYIKDIDKYFNDIEEENNPVKRQRERRKIQKSIVTIINAYLDDKVKEGVLEKATKGQDKVAKVMREFKAGELKDSHGNKVIDRDQALAIAMSEAGLSKSEDKEETKSETRPQTDTKEFLEEMIKEHERLIGILKPHAEMDEKVKKELSIQVKELAEYKEELEDLKKKGKSEDEKIQKSIEKIEDLFDKGIISEDILIKARSGKYADNPVNRRLNRVGQPYGSKKQEDALKQPKTGKKEDEKKDGEPQNLEEQAKQTSGSALEQAAKEAKDPEVRAAAYKELDRREKEEKVQEEESGEKPIKTNEKKDNDGKNQQEEGGEKKLNEVKKYIIDKFKQVSTELSNITDYSDNTKIKDLMNTQSEISKYLQSINRVSDLNIENDSKKLKDFINFKGNLNDLFGDGDVLGTSIKEAGDNITFSALLEDGFIERTFDTEDNIVYMDLFLLNPLKDKGNGIGTEIFKNQLNKFKELGFKKLVTDASQASNMNGYYTWARLGYSFAGEDEVKMLGDMLKHEDDHDISKFNNLPELMMSDKGRKWWREYGFSFTGVFDLDDNSENMKIFKNYIDEKNKDKK